jgi:hypothetical protein
MSACHRDQAGQRNSGAVGVRRIVSGCRLRLKPGVARLWPATVRISCRLHCEIWRAWFGVGDNRARARPACPEFERSPLSRSARFRGLPSLPRTSWAAQRRLSPGRPSKAINIEGHSPAFVPCKLGCCLPGSSRNHPLRHRPSRSRLLNPGASPAGGESRRGIRHRPQIRHGQGAGSPSFST